MAICPNCGNKAGEGAVFCDQCGTRLPQTEAAVPEATAAPAGGSVICPACGAGNVPGEAFCDYCGSPLDAPSPAVAVTAPAESEAAPEAQAAPETEAAPEPEAAEPALEVATPAEPEAAPPEGAAAAAVTTCPACGADVLPGEAFCANCGASLAQAPIPPEPVMAEEEEEPAAVPAAAAVPEAEAAVEPEAEAEAAGEAEPEVAPAEAPPPGPVTAPGTTCPACGAEIEPGDAFCSACGYALQEPAAPQPDAVEAAVSPPPPPPPASPAGPRLVVSTSGAEIPLPEKDEILVGREDPVSGVYPDVDLTPHGGEEGGVSRRHARLVAEGGKYYVEDLDSTNFTFVNKQKLAPRARQEVGEGDTIRFGRVEVAFRTG